MVALICCFMFGATVNTDVLTNIAEPNPTTGLSYWESQVTQFAFVVVLICHIPFIFFSGKEGLLIFIDEIDRKSISSALWHKMNATAPRFSMAFGAESPPNPSLPIPGDPDQRPYSELAGSKKD